LVERSVGDERSDVAAAVDRCKKLASDAESFLKWADEVTRTTMLYLTRTGADLSVWSRINSSACVD